MSDQGSNEQLLELLIQLKRTTPKAARDILNNQPAISYALISLMVSMGAINVEVFQKTLAQYHETNGRGQGMTGLPANAPTPSISATLAIPAIPPHLQPQQLPYRTSTPPTNLPSLQPNTYAYPTQQPAYATPPPPPSLPSVLQSTAAIQQGYPPPTNNYASYGAQPQQSQLGYGSYPPSNSAGYGVSQAAPAAAAVGGTPVGVRPGQSPQQQQQQQQPSTSFRPEMLAAFPEDQKALIMHVVSMSQEQLNSLPPDQRGTYMQIRATLGIS